MKKNVSASSATDYEAILEQLSQLPKYGIGRAADNPIQLPDKAISKYHAWLTPCGPTTYLLEDRASKYGTFVDELRITRKIVSRTESVRFANETIILNELINSYLNQQTPPKLPPKANPLDFTDEFALLRAVYEQYPKLRRNCRNRDKMIRTGSVIISSIVGIGAAANAQTGAQSILPLFSSAGLSVLIPTLCSGLLSTDEKLEFIDKEYREQYRCPNPDCRDPFAGREWHQLALQKTCRRCKANWVA